MAKISNSMCTALCEQVGREFTNAVFYLNVAGLFHDSGLEGFAALNRKHHEEELGHGQKFFDYIAERNGVAKVGAIEDVPMNFVSPVDIYENIYKRETATTEHINLLYQMAVQENDFITQQLLDWFENEQIEEERTAWEIMTQLKLIGTDKAALALYDKELE